MLAGYVLAQKLILYAICNQVCNSKCQVCICLLDRLCIIDLHDPRHTCLYISYKTIIRTADIACNTRIDSLVLRII